MSLEAIIILLIVYGLFRVIGQVQRKLGGGSERELPRRPQPDRSVEAQYPSRSVDLGTTARSTQGEGAALERILRGMEQILLEGSEPPAEETVTIRRSKARGPMGRGGSTPLPSAEEFEERASLEGEEEVVSLEEVRARPLRTTVAQDDSAEEIVRRRIQQAAARDRPLGKTDHVAFDQRIRQAPADKTAVRRITTKQLRDAFVWREILGPPRANKRADDWT